MKRLQFTLTRSISRKLLLMLMGMAVFAAVLTAGLISAYEHNAAEKAQKENLQSLAQIVSPNLTAALIFEDLDGAQELIDPLIKREEIVHAKVLNTDGVLLAEAKSPKLAQSDSSQLNQESIALVMEGTEYGTLILLADNSYIDERVSFYTQFLLVLLFATLLLSFILSLFLRQVFIRPILHLASVAEKVTNTSNYNLRATRFSEDEIGDLTQYFNGMLETIEYRESLLESLVQERTRELKRANNKLHQQAYNDSLSGLPNRLYLYEKLQSLVKKHQRSSQKFALLFIDLDGFKEVNDTLGHDYGDILLVHAGQRILGCVRDTDVVARLGGDEFTVLIKWGPDRNRVSQIAEQILNRLSDPFDLEGETAFVSGSIGITLFPEDADNVDTLIKNADQAMYESKNSGKNCYHYYIPSMDDRVQARKALIEDLRVAIDTQQFEIHYQPIVNMDSGLITKAEALIRWRHPKRGMVPPIEFIPVAEEVGLISEIGEWVANQACKDLAWWQSGIAPLMQISINASPAQLQGDTNWLKQWFSNIQELNLADGSITLEITESLLMEADESIRHMFASLREHGIRIALDDFGVGYSSLSYLQQMDIDILKIDRSFIHNLATEGDSLALCKAIITMAHHLELEVVAEGIETEQQKELLYSSLCDYGQGYLFAKPVPAEELEQMLLKQSDFNPQVA